MTHHTKKQCDKCKHEYLHVINFGTKHYCRVCFPKVTTQIPRYHVDGKLKIIKVEGKDEVQMERLI